MTAYKLAKETPEQKDVRQKAVEQATLLAIQAPMGVVHKSVRVLELVEQVMSFGNISAITDAATGAALATASIIGAEYNIRINARQLPTAVATTYVNELESLKKHAAEIETRIHKILHERGL
jgi:formiminotetrahydrofolate cyclodeaminase